MKTANKLARIARANQQGTFNLIQNGEVIHSGSYNACRAIMDEVGGNFTIEKAKEIDPHEQFQKKVRWGSHQYVRYVIKRCKELASKGYGSVEIKIDKSIDMFGVDKGRNCCYSADFVFTLLNKEGFVWKNEQEDHYDAVPDVIIWDRYLPQAPDSEKIGMCWK